MLRIMLCDLKIFMYFLCFIPFVDKSHCTSMERIGFPNLINSTSSYVDFMFLLVLMLPFSKASVLQ